MTDDLERRLREAAREAALPEAPESLHAFIARLPDEVPSAGNRAWLRPWLAPAGAAAVVIALAITTRALVSEPSPSPSTVVSHAPSARPTLTGVTRWGLSFATPQAWKLNETNVNEHYITVLGFVGNGFGDQPCTTEPPPSAQPDAVGVECHTEWDLQPGTAVVRFQSMDLLGSGDAPALNEPPPGYERVQVGGLPAFFAANEEQVPEADRTLSWVLSVPNDPGGSYHLTAGLRGPDVESLERQVRALVASIAFDPPVVALPTGADASAAARAAAARAITDLQAGDDAYACFPTVPGVTASADASKLPTLTFASPQPVECTTDLEASLLQLWRLTLTYSWEASADMPAGSTSVATYLSLDGSRVGGIRGSPIVPAQGLTRDEAILAARDAVPGATGWAVLRAESGTAAQLLHGAGSPYAHLGVTIAADRAVWVVNLAQNTQPLGGQGAIVVLDFVDGTVYRVVDWIS